MAISARPAARLVATLTLAVAAPAVPGSTSLPPLIDRELFFGDPQIAGAQISPDGRWLSFRRPYRDVMNIWVKPTAAPFDDARPVTADTERPVRGYFWTEDSRFILYVQDKGGDENFHVYAVDPDGEPGAEAGVPEARDLTPLEGIRALIYAVPEATPGRIIIGLNDRDPAMHDAYALDLDTGQRALLIRNEMNVGRWVADLDGTIRLAWRQNAEGGSEIRAVENGELGDVVYECGWEETCFPYRFHKNGRQAYIVSNKGDDVDLARLMLLDVETGQTRLVESDPEGEVDFGEAIFSDRTEELIATVYVGDRQRIYPRTDATKRDLAFLRSALPDGELGVASGTEDEQLWIVAVTRDVNPAQVFLYNRETLEVSKLYDSRPELPVEHLAEMRPVRYKARDGVQIPAYLTVPKGVEPKGLPAILLPHGGPWGRDTWGYDPFTQFLANRGYAVLQPNFRGSVGYGKAFVNAGNKEWGTGVMQHDLTDAVEYVVETGVADPDRVAIMGGSYGGYATLAGVTFTPDLYAAGVSIVGPSNIITLLESIPPYWGPIRKIFDKRVGDLDDPADVERLEAQSPFYHATQIKAPLLVIQGANDPRVKKAESDQIVVALRDLNRPVEYMAAPDEGHGFAGETNRLAMFAAIERFLAEHLGGRFQTGAALEVAERIEDLRVDVATLQMPTVPEEGRWARTAPLPVPDASRLRPVTLRYQTELTMPGGRQIRLDSTRTRSRSEREGRSVWHVESVIQIQALEARDAFDLDAATLVPLQRVATQGPMTITLTYGEDRITGSMAMAGQQQPLEVELEAPVFGNDSAMELVLCALPLKAGYHTTFRTFDVLTQKVRVWSLDVTGTETVEVPAGAFESFAVSLEAIDGEGGGGTTWICTDEPRVVVRGVFKRPPAMGGGTVTSVLAGME